MLAWGPYEIQAAIGAGGMGEVYRARDTRLKRDVALKILPETFATDVDRLTRFQREAEVLASLKRNGVVSSDGRWLAYEALESGRAEIYVRPYPETTTGHWQVSSAGGTRPLWSRDGTELFFVGPTGAIMDLGVEKGPSWTTTTPTTLIKEGYVTQPQGNPGRNYDVSSDRRRFLMVKPAIAQDTPPPTITVVQNWGEELKRLVPVK